MENQTTGDAGGVWVNGGELVMNPGVEIKKMAAQRGGGVLIDAGGQFFMNGGTIGGDFLGDGNTASGQNAGGAVLVAGGSFNMLDGKIQFNNTQDAVSGGGVLVMGGTFTMLDGKIQFNNTQDAVSGGGVLLHSGSFNMSGGLITGNTAGSNNYGVCIYGRLYSYDSQPSFMMTGPAEITSDNTVFLASNNATITIGGGLSASPAANIIYYNNPSAGTTPLLQASSSDLIADNYNRFLYNDESNHIKEIPTLYGYSIWFGFYK
jgi:hypothetical protein